VVCTGSFSAGRAASALAPAISKLVAQLESAGVKLLVRTTRD